MQGVYTATYQTPSLNTARTLMFITVSASTIVELLSVMVTQTNITAAEQLDIGLTKATSISPTPTATSVTPRPTEGASAVAASVVKANVTANEPTYDANVFGRQGVANVAGYFFEPLPEQRIIFGVSTTYGVRIFGTIANSYVFDVEMSFREIG